MTDIGFLEPIIRKIGVFELVQLAICMIAVALAFARPSIAASAFGKIELALARIAARPCASMLLIAALAIICRAVFIPLMRVEPLVPDELSLRLQADTYLHGRFGNPAIQSPDLTSIYTLLRPSYASMYPVLRSLPLVVGKLLGLDFWAGSWVTVVVLCVATYWMLRAYVSETYALIAALVVVARFSIFSVWVNSYFGAALTAIGGLLLIGGYARLVREPTWKSGLTVGAGAFLLMTTRPFEGMVFSIPAAIGLFAHFLRSPAQRRSLIAPGVVAASFVVAGLVLTTIHNQAVTGQWCKAPYTLYREVSGGSPAFLFASPTRPESPPRYTPERDTFTNEAINYAHGKSLHGVIAAELSRFEQYWNFYIGFALTPMFALGLFGLRRHPVLMFTSAALIVGLIIETFDWSQYAAPGFGVVMVCVALGLQSLRRWAPAGRPIGRSLCRLLPLATVAGLAIPVTSVLSANSAFRLPRMFGSSCCWIPADSAHTAAQRALSKYADKKFVVVDTGTASPPMEFVVYNDADIKSSPIIWLNEDTQLNPQTFLRYPGRTIWHLGWTELGSVCLQQGARGFGPAMPELKTKRYAGEWRKPSTADVAAGCLPL